VGSDVLRRSLVRQMLKYKINKQIEQVIVQLICHIDYWIAVIIRGGYTLVYV
jgi:hypothetical protein